MVRRQSAASRNAHSVKNDQAGEQPVALERPTRSRLFPVTVDKVADEAQIDAGTVRGIIGQLVARGLLWAETAPTWDFEPDDCMLTELGADVLDALACKPFVTGPGDEKEGQ
jgi:hypothetical protein